MPNTEELQASEGAQDTEQQVQEEQNFQPGELCAVEATNARIELPDDDQKEARENCVKGLFSKVAQRDMVSRRAEIRAAWKARYFDRGNQHILDGPKGTLITPSMVGMGGQGFNDHSDETNIYLGFRDILTAALTAALPSVRFEPDDPTNASDISAAENADKARILIERNNDIMVMLSDVARYLYTDGRVCIYTRHILDGQRFGYSNPGLSEIQDEVSYLPEEGTGPAEQDAQAEPGSQPGTQGTPRGMAVIKAEGVLETKVAIQANCIDDTPYLQFSRDYDITRGKTKYPEKADEITPSQAPTAESDYERLARTTIMMGMRPSSMTSDSMTYNSTEQMTWCRPEFYAEEQNDDMRAWLYETFPKGLMGVMEGKVLCELRNESMNDCWSMLHARSGDGAHRPALGSPVIPIQEKVNDCVELLHESFMHLIPRVWVASEVDVNALQDAERRPGQYLKAPKAPTGKGIAENFFTEQQIEIAEGLIQYMQWLFGEAPQFLSGGTPALFGGDTGKNDTLGGITIQRDQALGRIGLTWRNIRAAYALTMKQAVQAEAEYRQEVMSGSVPGEGKQLQTLSIDPQDLKGNIRCFPDQDDNFPESWVAKRAIWNNIIAMAEKNQLIAAILKIPQNLMLAKDKAGLPEMVIPGADSSEKQLGEIELLLQGAPEPNPALEEAKQQVAEAATKIQAAGVQPPPEAAQAIQQKLAQIPPMISTVPIGKLDGHASELAAIKTWANSSEGIRAKATNPQGFQNVEMHYDEHMAALQKEQAGNQPQGKPPSESINLKDLPPEGQVQLAEKGGIHLDLGQMQVKEAQDKAEKSAQAQARLQGKPQTEKVQ